MKSHALRRGTLLLVVPLLLMASVPSGDASELQIQRPFAPSTGSGSTGDDPETFTSNWSENVTFTELRDPLARFEHYPIADDDGDGLVNLVPLPYLPPLGAGSLGVAHVTDAVIADDLVDLNRTAEEVFDVVEPFVQDAETLSLAENLTLDGDYLDLVGLLRNTSAAITYWCGTGNAPQPLDWVMGVPVRLDCAGGGNGQVLVDTAGRPVYVQDSRTDDPTAYVFDGVDAHTTVVGVGSLDGRFTVGVGVRNHTFGALTAGDGAWLAEYSLRGMHKFAVDDTVNVTWTAGTDQEPASFNAEDRLYYTWGPNFTRSATAALVVEASTPGASADFMVSPQTQGVWDTTALFEDATGFDHVGWYLDAGDGHVFEANMTPVPAGIKMGYTPMPGNLSGMKHEFRFANPTQDPYYDQEMKATYYVDAQKQFTLQLKGVPGPHGDVEPGLPQASTFRVDLGDGPDGVASLDLTKRNHDSDGFYRTLVITGYTDRFPFEAQGDYVTRARYVYNETDPWEGDDHPFIMHAASFVNHGDSDGDSVLERRVADGFPVPYKGEMKVEEKSRSDPVYAWSFGPEPDTCAENCSGTLHKTETNKTLGDAFNAYFWHVWSVPDDSVDELDPDKCRLRHGDPKTGDCA